MRLESLGGTRGAESSPGQGRALALAGAHGWLRWPLRPKCGHPAEGVGCQPQTIGRLPLLDPSFFGRGRRRGAGVARVKLSPSPQSSVRSGMPAEAETTPI